MTPAAKIATTVARAMAERGDDVGPNVTLVLLAELEALADRVEVAERFARSQSDREFELLALLESRDQHIERLRQEVKRLWGLQDRDVHGRYGTEAIHYGH